MRFPVDECTDPRVAAWLRSEGHEVFSVYDEACGSDDESIIQKAFMEGWVVITNDKDFGEMVFREGRPHRGIIFLRLEDQTSSARVNALAKLLRLYSDDLTNRYVVVTDTGVRFART